MTIELMNQVMDIIIRGTLCGICLGFSLLSLIGIWKWFLGVMVRGLFYFFPGLEDWVRNRKKVKKNGDNNAERTR